MLTRAYVAVIVTVVRETAGGIANLLILHPKTKLRHIHSRHSVDVCVTHVVKELDLKWRQCCDVGTVSTKEK